MQQENLGMDHDDALQNIRSAGSWASDTVEQGFCAWPSLDVSPESLHFGATGLNQNS